MNEYVCFIGAAKLSWVQYERTLNYLHSHAHPLELQERATTANIWRTFKFCQTPSIFVMRVLDQWKAQNCFTEVSLLPSPVSVAVSLLQSWCRVKLIIDHPPRPSCLLHDQGAYRTSKLEEGRLITERTLDRENRKSGRRVE